MTVQNVSSAARNSQQVMNNDYLFVYGTLQRQTARHDLLQQHCEFVAEAVMQGKLYEVRGYPGLVDSDELGDKVAGEVYLIRQKLLLFAKLDDYEECSPSFPEPHEFRREQRTVTFKNGHTEIAWVYIYNHSTVGLQQILSGEYLKF